MMEDREIKFRVFDKKSGKMFRVTDIFNVSGVGLNGRRVRIMGNAPMESHAYATTTDTLTRSRTVLMQFTGLKDKNGVEIYEGDIVKYNTGETWVVKWVSRNASFEYVSNMKGNSLTQILGSHEVEIVGNIYKNPELLK